MTRASPPRSNDPRKGVGSPPAPTPEPAGVSAGAGGAPRPPTERPGEGVAPPPPPPGGAGGVPARAGVPRRAARARVDPQQLAELAGDVLRVAVGVPLAPAVARREPQHPVGPELDRAAV